MIEIPIGEIRVIDDTRLDGQVEVEMYTYSGQPIAAVNPVTREATEMPKRFLISREALDHYREQSKS